MSNHADLSTFDEARWTFQRAITSLDQAMTAKGHRWIYSGDRAETRIVVVNPENHPDVPPRWRNYPVSQCRMAAMTHRLFGCGSPGSSRR
jgi:hypothetical protein